MSRYRIEEKQYLQPQRRVYWVLDTADERHGQPALMGVWRTRREAEADVDRLTNAPPSWLVAGFVLLLLLCAAAAILAILCPR